MIDWSSGFSASFYMAEIDPVLWRDIRRMEITDASISRERQGLRQSADITCRQFDQSREMWVRIWLEASQGENTQKVPLFTGLAISPGTNINGSRMAYPVACYSVLKPAQDILLQRGWYAPAEAEGASLAARLLSVSPAPIVISENSPKLGAAIIAENGETNLSMAEKILDAIGWRLLIGGDGSINICPQAAGSVATFDALDNDVIEPQVTLTRDWYSCPNVYRAVQDDLSAVARDDAEDSFLSTASRGREVWEEEDGCNLRANETIGEYALRKLKESQSFATSVSYSRRYHPDINVGDIVTLHYPAQNLQGDFKVISQDISIGHGARVSEEVTA